MDMVGIFGEEKRLAHELNAARTAEERERAEAGWAALMERTAEARNTSDVFLEKASGRRATMHDAKILSFQQAESGGEYDVSFVAECQTFGPDGTEEGPIAVKFDLRAKTDMSEMEGAEIYSFLMDEKKSRAGFLLAGSRGEKMKALIVSYDGLSARPERGARAKP